MTTQRTRRGFSVRMFLVDGAPDGLRLVEKSNWSGRGLMCSRAQFPSIRQRTEFDRVGVYILVGEENNPAVGPRVYVGEGDMVRARIDSHVREKDFWTRLVLFTSKDDNLNKAHVQHLEARLVELAKTAKRSTVENANNPQLPNLSEADVSDVETFLDDVLLILPLLGIQAFEVVERGEQTGPRLVLDGKGIHAEGRDTPEGFVVYRGAKVVPETQAAASIHNYLVELRNELAERGVIVWAAAGPGAFAEDYVFN
ncbi:MAG: GIY-YIG nuclease family protein, partial [Deltaproteobacteria bacterium]